MATPSGQFRTQTDLITEVLANLGVLAAGQPTDPEDFNYVLTKLPAIYLMLEALEICIISDPNNIPGEWFSPLADIVAGECATKFGATPDDFVKLLSKGIGGIQGIPIGFGAGAMAIRAMNRLKPTGEPVNVEFF